MERTEVHIAYDGDALKSGVMDVQELAPALLAIGELIEHSNHILNGERAKMIVKVHSDFRTGSFEILLELAQGFSDQLAFWLGRDGRPWTAVEIAQLVGLSSGSSLGLIAFVKWLRGRAIKSVIEIGNDRVRIEVEGDHDFKEVTSAVAKLAKDARVRTSLRKLLRPIEQEGVDTFEVFDQQKKPVETIGKADLSYFEPPRETEEATENKIEVWVQVIGVFFEDHRKWQLFDGQQKFYATISDVSFIKRVDGGLESFKKGDRLKVQLLIRQVAKASGMHMEHEVLRVLDHWKTGVQTEFPYEDM